MQGTPHEGENVPPDKDREDSSQKGEGTEESAGSPEAPTGPAAPDTEGEPGTERDPDRKGPTPDSENPAG